MFHPISSTHTKESCLILTNHVQFLLFSITTPTYVLMLCSRLTGADMSFPDIVFARILMALVLFEFFADGQQWGKSLLLLSLSRPRFPSEDVS